LDRGIFFFFFVISDSITLLSLGGESLASILQHLQMTGAAFKKLAMCL
jgi:hypothetical protein